MRWHMPWDQRLGEILIGIDFAVFLWLIWLS